MQLVSRGEVVWSGPGQPPRHREATDDECGQGRVKVAAGSQVAV